LTLPAYTQLKHRLMSQAIKNINLCDFNKGYNLNGVEINNVITAKRNTSIYLTVCERISHSMGPSYSKK